MQLLDGIDVLRDIKSNADKRTIRVVMLTSSEEARHRLETYHLSVNSYLVKPLA